MGVPEFHQKIPTSNPKRDNQKKKTAKRVSPLGMSPLGVSLLRKTETAQRKKGVSLNGGGNMREKHKEKESKKTYITKNKH